MSALQNYLQADSCLNKLQQTYKVAADPLVTKKALGLDELKSELEQEFSSMTDDISGWPVTVDNSDYYVVAKPAMVKVARTKEAVEDFVNNMPLNQQDTMALLRKRFEYPSGEMRISVQKKPPKTTNDLRNRLHGAAQKHAVSIVGATKQIAALKKQSEDVKKRMTKQRSDSKQRALADLPTTCVEVDVESAQYRAKKVVKKPTARTTSSINMKDLASLITGVLETSGTIEDVEVRHRLVERTRAAFQQEANESTEPSENIRYALA